MLLEKGKRSLVPEKKIGLLVSVVTQPHENPGSPMLCENVSLDYVLALGAANPSVQGRPEKVAIDKHGDLHFYPAAEVDYIVNISYYPPIDKQ